MNSRQQESSVLTVVPIGRAQYLREQTFLRACLLDKCGNDQAKAQHPSILSCYQQLSEKREDNSCVDRMTQIRIRASLHYTMILLQGNGGAPVLADMGTRPERENQASRTEADSDAIDRGSC